MRDLMEGISKLDHGDLKEFAMEIKNRLSRTATPSEAEYIDAIYEAAKAIAFPVDLQIAAMRTERAVEKKPPMAPADFGKRKIFPPKTP